MTDVAASERSERVDELKQKIRELEDLLVQLGRESTDGILEAWRARIDALRVQADLGRMEVRDDTARPLDAADAAWHAARARLDAEAARAAR